MYRVTSQLIHVLRNLQVLQFSIDNDVLGFPVDLFTMRRHQFVSRDLLVTPITVDCVFLHGTRWWTSVVISN